MTYNTIGRHISKMVYTKVVTNKSPWLVGAELGGVYTNPASHGEGRFVADGEWIKRLFENGQVATQYCDPEGNISMNEEWNVTVLIVQSKESSVLTDVFLERWRILNAGFFCCDQHLWRAGYEDI